MYSYKNAYSTLYKILKVMNGGKILCTDGFMEGVLSRYALKKRKDYKQCSTAEEFLASIISDKDKIIAAIREDADLFKNGDPSLSHDIAFYEDGDSVTNCYVKYSTNRHGNERTLYKFCIDINDNRFNGHSSYVPKHISSSQVQDFCTSYIGSDKMPVNLRMSHILAKHNDENLLSVRDFNYNSEVVQFMKAMGCNTDAEQMKLFNEFRNPDSTVYFESSLFGVTFEKLIYTVLYDYSTYHSPMTDGTNFEYSLNIFEACL